MKFLIFILLIGSQAFAGGISGGGGGTVILNPVGSNRIEQILWQVRQVSFLFFNSRKGTDSLKVISQPTNADIHALLIKTQIYQAKKSACLDFDQKEVDGSVASPVSDTICISTKNLGEKLTDDNAFSQTMALVAHEYAHLLGATEDEANRIQNLALQEFNSFERGFYYRDLILAHEDFATSLGKFLQRIPRKSFDPLKGQLSDDMDPKVLGLFLGLNALDHANTYSSSGLSMAPLLMNAGHKMKLVTLFAKWHLIQVGFHSLFSDQIPHDPLMPNAPLPKAEYDQAFEGQTQQKVTVLFAQLFPKEFQKLQLSDSNLQVQKIGSLKDVADATDQLSTELMMFAQEVSQDFASLRDPHLAD